MPGMIFPSFRAPEHNTEPIPRSQALPCQNGGGMLASPPAIIWRPDRGGSSVFGRRERDRHAEEDRVELALQRWPTHPLRVFRDSALEGAALEHSVPRRDVDHGSALIRTDSCDGIVATPCNR